MTTKQQQTVAKHISEPILDTRASDTIDRLLLTVNTLLLVSIMALIVNAFRG